MASSDSGQMVGEERRVVDERHVEDETVEIVMIVPLLAIVMGWPGVEVVLGRRLDAEQDSRVDASLPGEHDPDRARHGALDLRPHPGDLLLGQEIGLVEHDQVGAQELVLVDLLERVVVVDRAVVRPLFGEAGRIVGEAALGHGRAIDHGHDAVDRHLGADLRPVEGLDEGLGQGEARRLDDNMVRARIARQQSLDGGHEIICHGAAQAPVGEFDDILVRAAVDATGAQDVRIDADISEFIDHEGEAASARLLEQVADHRGLAGAQKTGDDRDRNLAESAHAARPS